MISSMLLRNDDTAYFLYESFHFEYFFNSCFLKRDLNNLNILISSILDFSEIPFAKNL